MKNYLVRFVVTILIINCPCCFIVHKSTSQTMKELKFTNISIKTNSGKYEDKLLAFLTVDTIQKQSDRGLEFSIKFKNSSNIDDTIANPIDFFDATLRNNFGVDIFYPYTPRMYFRSTAPYIFESFLIEKVQVNGVETAIKLENKELIAIPAKGSYEIFFSIINVLKPNAVKPYTNDQKMRLPKGKYQLLVSLAINQGRIVRETKLKSLNIAPISIRYGN